MFKRFYRLIVLALCAALFLGIAAVFYVRFYWNRLEVANVFVDFSSFVFVESTAVGRDWSGGLSAAERSSKSCTRTPPTSVIDADCSR